MTLRHALRQDLQPEHDRLDRSLETLNLTDRDGLAAFLEHHYWAWSSLRGAGPKACAALDIRTHALAADLNALGGRMQTRTPTQVDDLAILYMAAGSMMGAAVLKKRWIKTSDPVVASAGRFLGLPVNTSDWHKLCSELESIPADSERGRVVITGAREIYHMFLYSITKNEMKSF